MMSEDFAVGDMVVTLVGEDMQVVHVFADGSFIAANDWDCGVFAKDGTHRANTLLTRTDVERTQTVDERGYVG